MFHCIVLVLVCFPRAFRGRTEFRPPPGSAKRPRSWFAKGSRKNEAKTQILLQLLWKIKIKLTSNVWAFWFVKLIIYHVFFICSEMLTLLQIKVNYPNKMSKVQETYWKNKCPIVKVIFRVFLNIAQYCNSFFITITTI